MPRAPRNPTLKRLFFRAMSLYPPYLGAGIRVSHVSEDFSTFRVKMGLRFFNSNYVGTHFGGSLYSMCDPFFMLILIQRLGTDYIVWDKAAAIRFRKPGRGTVTAEFHVPDKRVEEIRAAVEREGKVEPVFEVEVVDGEGEVVARVEKRLYVRRKEARTD